MIYTGLNNTGEVEAVYATKRATTAGTPPLSYSSKGYDLENFLISGNTVQNGTPSPEVPVDVVGCGVRTENLWDGYLEIGGLNGGSGEEYNPATHYYVRTNYLPLVKSDYPTVCVKVNGVHIRNIFMYNENKIRIATVSGYFDNGNGCVFSLLNACRYIRMCFQSDDKPRGTAEGNLPEINVDNVNQLMINAGDTPIGYEPPGYKIPVTVGNVTTPIYLGTVQTTRKIKKLVLTGNEDITLSSTDDNRVVGLFTILNMGLDYSRTGYCNILRWKAAYSQSEYNRIVATSRINFYLSLAKSILPEPTFNGFKSYLAAQYANGTPVTIWYILAEPETAVINEPLHKIGNYTDTISLAQSGVTISTTKGTNIITTDTAILPSSISVTTPEKEVTEVYAGINYQNPIFYSRKTLSGTSSLTFKGLGQPLKDYHIFGETVQNGTPSPDYPVDVQGVGEETSNLFYPYTVVKGRLDGGAIGYDSSTTALTINSNKVIYSINAGYRGVSTDFIKITSQNNKVTFFGSFSGPGGQYKKVVFYDEQKLWMNRDIDIAPSASEWTLSIPTGAKYLRISIMGERAGIDYNFNGFMVTPGQSVMPYEPYGYKIPVTIGNVTAPIYIGSDPLYRIGDCADEVDFGNQQIIRRIDPTTMQPYATPITSTITVPQLMTEVGDNTLTVDTTVKPSAVSVTGNIKPTGYGQLLDVNDVDIQDSNDTSIFIHG